MKLPLILPLTLVVVVLLLGLPSCQAIGSVGEGVSGTLFILDPDSGAKAGLDYRDGEGRAFARKDWRDPETGELIARTRIERRILSEK